LELLTKEKLLKMRPYGTRLSITFLEHFRKTPKGEEFRNFMIPNVTF
jgi:hypothetical protein